nr:pif-7 [Darna trima granulovirus]
MKTTNVVVFIVTIAITCIIVLYILKLNRRQEIKRLCYENKFIPTNMCRYVQLM